MKNSNTQQGNNFTLYLGIVLEDLVQGSDTIKVALPELTPFLEGSIAESDDNVQVSGGNGLSGNVNLRNYITARYLQIIPNRRYPPDVKKNEQVFVVNYADTDSYYWVGLEREDFLRKTERLNISVSDNPSSVDAITDDNSYYFEMDTGKKHVKISTANSNGESFRYLFEIDASAGTLTICDDADNEITLESATPRIFVKNTSGSVVDLNDKDITISAPESITIKAGKQVLVEAPMYTSKIDTNTIFECMNFAVDAKAGIMLKSAATAQMESGVCTLTNLTVGPVLAMAFAINPSPPPPIVMPINITSTGTSQDASNSPTKAVGGEPGRHSAAYEQMLTSVTALQAAVTSLVSAIEIVSGSEGTSKDTSPLTSAAASSATAAVASATASIMPMNKGT